MASTFSATLAAPTGLALATAMTGMSGKTYVPSGGQVVITDERDARALISGGWTVVTVSE
jgi:hypothetical protein